MLSLDLDTALKLASFALSIGAVIYAFFANRKKDTDARFEAVDDRFNEGSKRMDRHDGRIASLEQAIQAMPGKDDMHSLQLELVKQTGALAEMRAVMEGNQKIMARLENIVSRHEDHLLDGGKR